MQLVLPAPPPLLAPLFSHSQPGDDEIWVARAKNGEIAAFDALMNRHRAAILNLCFQILASRESAEDCAQEAFVRAFSSLNTFRGASGFKTWLYRIALNLALEKRRSFREVSSLEEAETLAVSSDGDLKMALESALLQLSEDHRVALVLREWHGLSYEEMARVCGVRVGTIRSRLNAARADFRRIWTQMEAQ